ncbi:MAG: hypothetical protein NC920_03720 [Candidatus Omnitrophica bacterium]|nr:hypothetical protein [Candidatus Omnitrophota bacterium]
MFKPRFASIKDLSEIRRLPRLGKIKLGIKLISQKTNQEYPKETEYFIVPPEVARVYGNKPTALEVMFPINDREVVFPQAFKWYGSMRGLKCVGNGDQALRLREEKREMEEIECEGINCEHFKVGECQRIGHLMVILPRVNMGGIYQIDVGSYHSIVDVNSGIDYVQALVGRFAMIPLRLCRFPKETHFEGQKQIHYTLQLFFDADIELLNELRRNTDRIILSTQNLTLPPPEAIDHEGILIEEFEEEKLNDISDKRKVGSEETVPSSIDKKVEGEKEMARSLFASSSKMEAKGRESQKGNNDAEHRITKQQIEAIKKLAERRGISANFSFLKDISYDTASKIISAMQKRDFNLNSFKREFEEVMDETPF